MDLDTYEVRGRCADPVVVVGADVLPWRPWAGAYVLLEQGAPPPEELLEVAGVAGAWWAASTSAHGSTLSLCFLDDDPPAVGERLRPVLARRREAIGVAPLLAAPFHALVPHEWDRYLP